MTVEQVTNEVKSIIIDKLELMEADYDANTKLNTVGVDSLDAVELIMELEKKYDIKIPDDDVKLEKLGDFAELVMKYVATEN